MQKVKVKGLAAVDPQSGLEDDGEVLSETKGVGKPVVYSATLTLTDLASGLNSYYKVRRGPVTVPVDGSGRWGAQTEPQRC